jgi:hypothetical protein
MTPDFPLISIYRDQALYIFKNDDKLRTISTFTFLKQDPSDSILYDRSGNKWTFKFINYKIKNDFKTRFLANTFYNPAIKVEVEWSLIGTYTLEALKTALCNSVDNDKRDLIAQFVEAETIKTQLKNCDSFDKIIDTLNKLVFQNFADT